MGNYLEKLESVIKRKSFMQLAGMTALVVSLAFNPAPSAATDAGADAEEAASTSDDAGLMVEKMIEEWLQAPGRAFREKSYNVVRGTALVSLNSDDKRWGNARSLAYQDAFVQAMGAYMKSVRQRTSVSLMRDYFAEDIPESQLEYQEGEASDSYVKRVVQKSAALIEQTIDQKLADSGMSDDEIRRLSTPVQKRTTFENRISRRTLNEAIGSAAGLIPVKTFEHVDDEGNGAIGVVAVFSERMRRIANQISRGDVIRPDPDRPRDSIMDQIASYENSDLPNEFGVRVMWDEQGYPAIVSFGQWGWSPANLSKKKRAQRRKFALKQAGNDALSHLTVFIKASTRFSEESNVGVDVEEAFNLPRGGIPEEIEEVEIADKLVETAGIKAEMALTGYTPARSWSARHPLVDEQELVGVVAYWSPAREDAIRKTVGQRAKHALSTKEATRKRTKTHAGGSTQSREPNLADF